MVVTKPLERARETICNRHAALREKEEEPVAEGHVSAKHAEKAFMVSNVEIFISG